MADPRQTPKLKLKKQYAQALLDAGLTYKKIARIISKKEDDNGNLLYGPVVATTVEKWMERGYLRRSPLPFRVYNDFFKLKGNWFLASDWHAPYHDDFLVEMLIKMRQRFNEVPNLLIPGDFLDMAVLSDFKDEKGDFEQEVEIARELITKLNKYFKTVIYLLGNHDIRSLRLLNFELGAETFSRIISKDMKISDYPFCTINNKWRITHPRSYSRLPTRVANAMAIVHKMHSGIAHGHLMGVTYSPSGEEICFDLGGMFDPLKIRYKNLQDTTHGKWVPGFSMIRENFLYQFPKDHTDWDWWLKK